MRKKNNKTLAIIGWTYVLIQQTAVLVVVFIYVARMDLNWTAKLVALLDSVAWLVLPPAIAAVMLIRNVRKTDQASK